MGGRGLVATGDVGVLARAVAEATLAAGLAVAAWERLCRLDVLTTLHASRAALPRPLAGGAGRIATVNTGLSADPITANHLWRTSAP